MQKYFEECKLTHLEFIEPFDNTPTRIITGVIQTNKSFTHVGHCGRLIHIYQLIVFFGVEKFQTQFLEQTKNIQTNMKSQEKLTSGVFLFPRLIDTNKKVVKSVSGLEYKF